MPLAKPLVHLSLERWGMPQAALDSLLPALNACDTRLAWRAAGQPGPVDMVVHLVDLEGLAGTSHAAVWNLAGPIHALRAARAAGTPAIALVRGQASQLPMVRAGCWVASGRHDLLSAARILAGAAITPDAGERAGAIQHRLSALAAMNVTAVLHRAVATSAEALASTLQELLEAARQQGYAGASQACVGIGQTVQLPPAQGSLPPMSMLRSQATETEADLLLAYPWPDLQDSW